MRAPALERRAQLLEAAGVGIVSGGMVLMPCEDHERVDELRTTLGMGPLADYLALFEERDESRPVRRIEEVVPIPPPSR